MSTYSTSIKNEGESPFKPGERVIMPTTNDYVPTKSYPMQETRFACIGTVKGTYKEDRNYTNVNWDNGNSGIYVHTLLQLIGKEALPENPNTGFRMSKSEARKSARPPIEWKKFNSKVRDFHIDEAEVHTTDVGEDEPPRTGPIWNSPMVEIKDVADRPNKYKGKYSGR